MHTFKSDLFLFAAGVIAVVSVVGVDTTGLVNALHALFA